MIILCLVILLINNKICENANILVIAPFPGKSHFNMFQGLLKELATRGHEVDVVSHFPLKNPIPRYNDLSIKGTIPILVNNLTIEYMRKNGKNPFQQIMLLTEFGGKNLCEKILNTKTVQNLRNTTKKYDLLIIHYFGSNCILGFAHLYKIPSIVITTSVNLPWTSSLIGLPDNPSYIPNYFTSLLPTMTITERVLNTVILVSAKIGFEILSNRPCNIVAKKFFGPQLPNLEDLAKNISLVMVNSHFSLHQPRPAVPNFLEVGGIHIHGNTTLSAYFEESLTTDMKGIIYLSFGSMLLTETLPEEKLVAFFQTFKHLPYKIMWKAIREKFPKHIEIPSNIQFEPWMPQLGILCHPNVKLFITHGGMLGIMEAVYCGVPILGIPIFGDQPQNLRNSVSKGIAIDLPYNDITEDTVRSATELLLNNSTYTDNAKRMFTLFRDRPNSSLETAIYWIEYVIKYNGAPHLRSAGADLPWYQYYLVDVIGILVFIGLSAIIILYKLLIFIFSNLILLIPKGKLKKE